MKQFLYIVNMDDYLNGNFDNCFTLTSNPRMDNYDGWKRCGEVEFEVNIDIEKAMKETIGIIDATIKEEMAEHELKINLLKEKKQNLLAIEHKS